MPHLSLVVGWCQTANPTTLSFSGLTIHPLEECEYVNCNANYQELQQFYDGSAPWPKTTRCLLNHSVLATTPMWHFNGTSHVAVDQALERRRIHRSAPPLFAFLTCTVLYSTSTSDTLVHPSFLFFSSDAAATPHAPNQTFNQHYWSNIDERKRLRLGVNFVNHTQRKHTHKTTHQKAIGPSAHQLFSRTI